MSTLINLQNVYKWLQMLFHGEAATADPMLCSSLFIDRIDIHVHINRQ